MGVPTCSFAILLLAVVLAAWVTSLPISEGTYETMRNQLNEMEQSMLTGGQLQLTPKEELVDRILKHFKRLEIANGLQDTTRYAPAQHFFQARPLIERSTVFKIIQMMPKGSLLHIHNAAAVSSEWVVKNLTYREDARLCRGSENLTVLTIDNFEDCETDPELISDLRGEHENPDEFDAWLEQQINLNVSQPDVEYPDSHTVWKKFQDMFRTFGSFLNHEEAFVDYHRRLLEEMYEDNVMYIELRTGISQFWVNETWVDADETVKALQGLVNEFKEEHPDFVGLKIIYSLKRRTNGQKLEKKLKAFSAVAEKFSDFMIGFDLVGHEDIGPPLYDFRKLVESLPNGTKVFFHAGETNWFGEEADINLIDAILLNTTRIGHGYAILKHPLLWNTVKVKNIPIEVSPISNQVLGLVHDMRNHPGAFFLSENIPIVISNDDPGFWGARGVSYDYYYALMAFAPSNAGLKTLKQLVWNSIKYSVLTTDEYNQYVKLFQSKWDEFLDRVIQEFDPEGLC